MRTRLSFLWIFVLDANMGGMVRSLSCEPPHSVSSHLKWQHG